MSKNKIRILIFILYLTSEIYSLQDAKSLTKEAKDKNNGKSFVYEVSYNLINPSTFNELKNKIQNENIYTISLFIINEKSEKDYVNQLDEFLHYGASSNYIVLLYSIYGNNQRKIEYSAISSKLNSKCFETANSKISTFTQEDIYLVKLIDSLIANKDFCLKSDKNDAGKDEKPTKINSTKLIILIILIVIIVVIFCYYLNKIYNKQMNEAMGIPNQQYQNINNEQRYYPQAQPGTPENQQQIVEPELPILPINDNNNLNVNNYPTPNVNYQSNINNNYQTPNVNYQQNQQNNFQQFNNNNYPQNPQNNFQQFNNNNYPQNPQNNYQQFNNNYYPQNPQNNYQIHQ